jgi:hypothetical protein
VSVKHILAPMISAEADEPALIVSRAVAEQFGAQVAVLIVAINPACESAWGPDADRRATSSISQ